MELAPMRYKNFVWPHNPRVYTIEYRREMGEHKVPFGRYHLQDLGPTRRVMKGEGEFVGEDAYERFKELATVFYQEGPGVLAHPVWQAANAYFTELKLEQEPRRNYVRYTFTFVESYDGYQAYARKAETSGTASGSTGTAAAQTAETGKAWHTVVKGESLWSIAGKYGTKVSDILSLNPQIKNPNLIYVGERVRVK